MCRACRIACSALACGRAAKGETDEEGVREKIREEGMPIPNHGKPHSLQRPVKRKEGAVKKEWKNLDLQPHLDVQGVQYRVQRACVRPGGKGGDGRRGRERDKKER
jgi:hypothetical protein